MNFSLKIIFLILIICFWGFFGSNSQELEQIFNTPQYYNSAFAGYEHCSVGFLSNKMHFVTLNKFFLMNNILFEYFDKKISGAFQVSIGNSFYTEKIFIKNKISLAYTYHNRINRKTLFSLSLQSKYIQEKINTDNLIFPDMISVYNSEILPTTETITLENKNEVIFCGGVLLYNKKYFFSVFVDNFFSVYNNTNTNEIKRIIFINEYQLFSKRDYFDIKLNFSSFIFKNYYFFTTGCILENNIIELGLYSKQNFYDKNLSNGANIYTSIKYNKLQIAYSYTFYYGKLFFKKSSIHELSLKIRINCTEKNFNNTIICPTY